METKSNGMKIFIILMITAIVLIAAAAVTIFFVTRDDGTPTDEEYLPKDYGDDPSGLDDDYTARY